MDSHQANPSSTFGRLEIHQGTVSLCLQCVNWPEPNNPPNEVSATRRAYTQTKRQGEGIEKRSSAQVMLGEHQALHVFLGVQLRRISLWDCSCSLPWWPQQSYKKITVNTFWAVCILCEGWPSASFSAVASLWAVFLGLIHFPLVGLFTLQTRNTHHNFGQECTENTSSPSCQLSAGPIELLKLLVTIRELPGAPWDSICIFFLTHCILLPTGNILYLWIVFFWVATLVLTWWTKQWTLSWPSVSLRAYIKCFVWLALWRAGSCGGFIQAELNQPEKVGLRFAWHSSYAGLKKDSSSNMLFVFQVETKPLPIQCAFPRVDQRPTSKMHLKIQSMEESQAVKAHKITKGSKKMEERRNL